MKQLRALQILETVNLMAGGLPHRMRFKAFISRYRLLVPFKLLNRDEDKMAEDCKVSIQNKFTCLINIWPKLILENFERIRKSLNYASVASTSWVLGKKHIFLSEGAGQRLEIVRTNEEYLQQL